MVLCMQTMWSTKNLWLYSFIGVPRNRMYDVLEILLVGTSRRGGFAWKTGYLFLYKEANEMEIQSFQWTTYWDAQFTPSLWNSHDIWQSWFSTSGVVCMHICQERNLTWLARSFWLSKFSCRLVWTILPHFSTYLRKVVCVCEILHSTWEVSAGGLLPTQGKPGDWSKNYFNHDLKHQSEILHLTVCLPTTHGTVHSYLL